MFRRLILIAALTTVAFQLVFRRPDLILRDFAFGGIPFAIAVTSLLGPFWKRPRDRSPRREA